VHALQLALLGAALESVADIVDRYDSLLFSVRVGRRLEIAEVVKGRVLSTTRPEWIYLHIRELIREAYRKGWIVSRLGF